MLSVDRMREIEIFIHVVETGSFSKAARLLQIGQPSISKAIAQLEQRLDVSLLNRSTRGLVPSEAGQRFYERAKHAVEVVDDAENAARDCAGGLSGRLRVSAPVTFARSYVIALLKPFLQQHPQLSLEVVMDDRNIDLLGNGIDVALRMGVLADSSMTARKIGCARRIVVATPAHLAQAGIPYRPEDLAGKEFVIYDSREGGNAWTFVHASGEKREICIAGRLRVTAGEGLKAGVLADLGLAIVSEWLAGPELAEGRMQQVLADWALPAIDLWAVYPGGRRANLKARSFVDFIEQHLK